MKLYIRVLLSLNTLVIYKVIRYVIYLNQRGAYYKSFDWFKVSDVIILVFAFLLINEIIKYKEEKQ